MLCDMEKFYWPLQIIFSVSIHLPTFGVYFITSAVIISALEFILTLKVPITTAADDNFFFFFFF